MDVLVAIKAGFWHVLVQVKCRQIMVTHVKHREDIGSLLHGRLPFLRYGPHVSSQAHRRAIAYAERGAKCQYPGQDDEVVVISGLAHNAKPRDQAKDDKGGASNEGRGGDGEYGRSS